MSVNGPALGGGLGLVAQGHIVIASQASVFGLPEIRIGLWPFLVYRAVEAALGARRTLELSLLGCPFHAAEALQWGLVHQLCPADELAERAHTLARELAKASPRAIAAGMQYYRDSRGKSLKEAGEIAAALRSELMASGDFQEGRAAFREKREPRWPSLYGKP
jgi:enoyl-CoA hydratase/carnithine racemase